MRRRSIRHLEEKIVLGFFFFHFKAKHLVKHQRGKKVKQFKSSTELNSGSNVRGNKKKQLENQTEDFAMLSKVQRSTIFTFCHSQKHLNVYADKRFHRLKITLC